MANSMAKSMAESGASARGARIFGFPLEGFSLFQSLLLAFASAFLTFFSTTCAAIFALLAWNLVGGHSVSYADTYLYVGFPAGVLVLVIALPLFLALWVRAKARE
jgi:ABC-type nickel/cobalt efflux system permease component RcnA